jgi:hypothetical protein
MTFGIRRRSARKRCHSTTGEMFVFPRIQKARWLAPAGGLRPDSYSSATFRRRFHVTWRCRFCIGVLLAGCRLFGAACLLTWRAILSRIRVRPTRGSRVGSLVSRRPLVSRSVRHRRGRRCRRSACGGGGRLCKGEPSR